MTAAFGLIGQYREERRSRPPVSRTTGRTGKDAVATRRTRARADDPLHFEQLSYDEPLVGPVARI